MAASPTPHRPEEEREGACSPLGPGLTPPHPCMGPREEWVTPLTSLCTDSPTPVPAATPLLPPGLGRTEWGGCAGCGGCSTLAPTALSPMSPRCHRTSPQSCKYGTHCPQPGVLAWAEPHPPRPLLVGRGGKWAGGHRFVIISFVESTDFPVIGFRNTRVLRGGVRVCAGDMGEPRLREGRDSAGGC